MNVAHQRKKENQKKQMQKVLGHFLHQKTILQTENRTERRKTIQYFETSETLRLKAVGGYSFFCLILCLGKECLLTHSV